MRHVPLHWCENANKLWMSDCSFHWLHKEHEKCNDDLMLTLALLVLVAWSHACLVNQILYTLSRAIFLADIFWLLIFFSHSYSCTMFQSASVLRITNIKIIVISWHVIKHNTITSQPGTSFQAWTILYSDRCAPFLCWKKRQEKCFSLVYFCFVLFYFV